MVINALVPDLLHRLRQHLANLAIAICGNGGDLPNLLIG
jgi:hypothetical protein